MTPAYRVNLKVPTTVDDCMTKRTPATPLPWKIPKASAYAVSGCSPSNLVCNAEMTQDAAYISHAANAYPRLVAAVQLIVEHIEHDQLDGVTFEENAGRLDLLRALLRELGE